MTTHAPSHAPAILGKLGLMPDGVYMLTAPVPNRARDKRKRYGSTLQAASDFRAGTLWVLSRHEQERGWVEALFVERGAGTQISFLVNPDGRAHVAGTPGGMVEKVALAVLAALTSTERTFATIEAAACSSAPSAANAGWGALRQLYAVGRITLDDLEAALAAHKARDFGGTT